MGFRPFFALATLAGLGLPLLWVLMLAGMGPTPKVTFSLTQWHAHEMFYGFGWAVLGGFLLTATKNWVRVRGWHGGPLVFLCGAWLLERAGMWLEATWPAWLFRVSNNLFLATIVAMLLATLLWLRSQDTFPDNGLFVVALPAFLAAKWCLLSPDHQALGVSMTLGLFRVAFLVMLERTLTQFMKAAFGATIFRHAGLDGAIKGLGLALVLGDLMPRWASAWTGLLLATLMLARLLFWKPHKGFRRLDVAVMFLGYLALAAQLVLEFGRGVLGVSWLGATSVHVFTLGAMGLIIPSMVVRLAKGHTGRKVSFDGGDKAVLWVMLLAFGFRVVAPALDASRYSTWLALTAGCWLVAFATLAVRYVPHLARPRADGKEH